MEDGKALAERALTDKDLDAVRQTLQKTEADLRVHTNNRLNEFNDRIRLFEQQNAIENARQWDKDELFLSKIAEVDASLKELGMDSGLSAGFRSPMRDFR